MFASFHNCGILLRNNRTPRQEPHGSQSLANLPSLRTHPLGYRPPSSHTQKLRQRERNLSLSVNIVEGAVLLRCIGLSPVGSSWLIVLHVHQHHYRPLLFLDHPQLFVSQLKPVCSCYLGNILERHACPTLENFCTIPGACELRG